PRLGPGKLHAHFRLHAVVSAQSFGARKLDYRIERTLLHDTGAGCLPIRTEAARAIDDIVTKPQQKALRTGPQIVPARRLDRAQQAEQAVWHDVMQGLAVAYCKLIAFPADNGTGRFGRVHFLRNHREFLTLIRAQIDVEVDFAAPNLGRHGLAVAEQPHSAAGQLRRESRRDREAETPDSCGLCDAQLLAG